MLAKMVSITVDVSCHKIPRYGNVKTFEFSDVTVKEYRLRGVTRVHLRLFRGLRFLATHIVSFDSADKSNIHAFKWTYPINNHVHAGTF